jgi:hypothetical protein
MKRLLPWLLTVCSIAEAFAGVDAPLVPNSADGTMPRVALTRSGAAYVWYRGGLFAAVTGDLPILPDEQVRVADNADDAEIASDGRNALVVWTWARSLWTMPIGPGVRSYGPNIIASNVGAARPAVAWNGSKYVVAWSHVSNAVVATTVDVSGKAGGPIQVLQRSSDHVPAALSIASSGDDSLVAWERDVMDPSCAGTCIRQAEIDTVVVDRDGRPRDASATLAAGGADPDLAWNGREYFVIWTGFPAGGILGRRVAPDGAAVDATPIAVTSQPDRQGRIAWNGSGYTLIWLHAVSAYFHVWHAPMSEEGTLGAPQEFAGRFVTDFDVAGRPSGEVVLVRAARPGVADNIAVRLLLEPTHRRRVTR